MPRTSRDPRSSLRRRRDGDSGFTLIEMVITVVLIGVVVLAILQSVTTTIKASAVGRAAAQVETTVVNAADRVNRAPKRCDYTIYAQAAVLTQGWPATSAVVTHEYYVPGPDSATAGTWATGVPAAPGCPGVSPDDLLVQRVTILITSPDGRVHRSIQVVKSDV